MNERRVDPAMQDDERLKEIFRHATPRPRPSDAARERAWDALHGRWQRQVAARRRRRFGLAAAAALALAVAGLTLLDDRQVPADALPAGFEVTVARLDGAGIDINGRRHTDGASLRLGAGDRLRLAEDARVALVWPGGGSLRLDGGSRVEIGAAALHLEAGGLYFDSTPWGRAGDADSRLVVRTPLGEIRHAGTQFLVHLEADGLDVAVREGSVTLRGDRVGVDIDAGEGMRLAATGGFTRHRVTAYDERWQWAAAVAPELALDGRSVHDVLQWVARETGREIDYRSAEARGLAANEARGIGTLAPMAALRTLPVMTSLDIEVVGGRIRVDDGR